MAHEHSCQADASPDNGHRGADTDQCNSHYSQEATPGIGDSITPGVPRPETVLAAVMTNGSYLLVSYPQGGPTAFVVTEDAEPLRQALQGALGSPVDEGSGSNGRNGNGKHTGAMAPGHGALYCEQIQP